MAQRVGLVLAGGRGERLGRSKGDLSYDGKTLAERASALLWPICGSVLVSLSEGVENPAPNYPPLVDPPPSGRGPLAGIDAAFEATGDADLLVLACDYPCVTQALLRRLHFRLRRLFGLTGLQVSGFPPRVHCRHGLGNLRLQLRANLVSFDQ